MKTRKTMMMRKILRRIRMSKSVNMKDARAHLAKMKEIQQIKDAKKNGILPKKSEPEKSSKKDK